MEALFVDKIPAGKEWQYEPKWAGFRCLAFKDGKDVELQSKNRQTLSRYFAEPVSALRQIKADKFVLDGNCDADRWNVRCSMPQVERDARAVSADTFNDYRRAEA
jgi:ATP-dependent DNA ligase